jgi:two-component system copper resistance phosphate regulon response regulator CusR
MRILVVEDEKKTAAYLRKGLAENGFEVDVAARGEEGLRAALDGAHDLLILDVMLPQLDGWAILSELRRAGKTTPVLFLTARDSIHDRVKGLELGADDYLVKPFAFSELLARVHSILRRSTPRTTEAIAVADLQLDLVRQKAIRGGQRLDLTPREFTLLTVMVLRRGEVLSRPFLAEEVWDIEGDDSNVVDVHVRRLRSKVDDPFERKLIHTVRGVGYVLEDRP